jgi:hypothetical protein
MECQKCLKSKPFLTSPGGAWTNGDGGGDKAGGLVISREKYG